MRDSLPHPHYFEFAYSREPTWHSEHMASAMLDMFRSHARVPAARRGGSGAESVLPPAFQGVAGESYISRRADSLPGDQGKRMEVQDPV